MTGEPVNAELSERVALGAALYEVGAAEHLIRSLPPAAFSVPQHGEIVLAIRDAWEIHGSTDVALVAQVLLDRGKLETCGGEAYLKGLRADVDDAALRDGALRLDAHIEAVRKTWRLREVGFALPQIADAVQRGAADEVVTRLLRAHELVTAETRSAAFPTVRADEMPENEEDDAPDWLVPDLWTVGGCGFIGGEPKAYKSMLLADLLAAVATGGDFLGRRVKGPSPVALYAAEDSRRLVLRRLARIGRARGLPGRPPVHLIDPTGPLMLDDPATLDRIARTVREMGLALIGLDPFMALTQEEENSPAIARALYALRDRLKGTDCGLVFVHHLRKSEGLPGDRLATRLRGSSALFGWVDCLWSVGLKEGSRKLDEGQRILEVELREEQPPPPFLFRINEPLDTTGRRTLGFEVLAEQDREAIIEGHIMDAVRAAPEGLGTRELRDAVKGFKALAVDAARDRLVGDGKINRANGTGGKILYSIPCPNPGTRPDTRDTPPPRERRLSPCVPCPQRSGTRARDTHPQDTDQDGTPTGHAGTQDRQVGLAEVMQ